MDWCGRKGYGFVWGKEVRMGVGESGYGYVEWNGVRMCVVERGTDVRGKGVGLYE